MSGYRAQSDWYRNMRTSPSTTVYPRRPVLRPMWVIMRQRWPSSKLRCQRYRYRGRVNANFSSPVGLDGARTVMVFLLLHGRNSVHAPYEAFSLSSGSFSVRNVVLRAYLTSERYGPFRGTDLAGTTVHLSLVENQTGKHGESGFQHLLCACPTSIVAGRPCHLYLVAGFPPLAVGDRDHLPESLSGDPSCCTGLVSCGDKRLSTPNWRRSRPRNVGRNSTFIIVR